MATKKKSDRLGRPVYTGDKSAHWKGGRITDANGYVLVRVGKQHHLAHCTGYAYEHRVIAEAMIGRKLRSGEVVHHSNKKRNDNRPSNLKVFKSDPLHRVTHRKKGCIRKLPGESNRIAKCACGCGMEFLRFDKKGRPRFVISGHNKLISNRAKLECEAWLEKRGQA